MIIKPSHATVPLNVVQNPAEKNMIALNPGRCCLSWTWCRWRGWAPPAPASTSWPRQGWKKPGLIKKTQPSVFFLSFFYLFAQKREFLGFFQFQEHF
jgi:hypothetical protein